MLWRKIKAFPAYSVSEDGRVRNDRTGHILKARRVVGDLYQVSLNGKFVYVHRLQQQAFFGREYVIPELSMAPVVVYRRGGGWLPEGVAGVIIVQDGVGYARQSGFVQAVKRELGADWRVWSRKETLYICRK